MAGSITQLLASNNVDLVLGPLLIGAIFNAFVYGICFLQFSIYWTSQWNDSYVIKCDSLSVYHLFHLLIFGYRLLVGWTFLLDTFHTSALTYALWVYAVDNFLNPSFLRRVLWPYSTTPIVTTLYDFFFLNSFLRTRRRVLKFNRTSFPIQVYLSWRIKQFAKSQRVLFYLVLLALAQASLGFTCSIIAFQVPEWAFFCGRGDTASRNL